MAKEQTKGIPIKVEIKLKHFELNSFFLVLIYLFLAALVLVIACWLFLLVAHRRSCSRACGILTPQPGPGMEPASLILEGGFLTTGSPGKSMN